MRCVLRREFIIEQGRMSLVEELRALYRIYSWPSVGLVQSVRPLWARNSRTRDTKIDTKFWWEILLKLDILRTQKDMEV